MRMSLPLFLFAFFFMAACGFPEYVYDGPVITGPEVTTGIRRAEALAGESFKRDDLVVGTKPEICGKTYMACVIRPNLIMVSEGYPIAAQVCHEVLHILALDYHDIWDHYHNLYDYDECNV